jgi:hypothetical protein
MSILLPKNPRIELKDHLDYVRSLPSIASGQEGCIAHHLLMGWGRKGEKPHDFWTVPLTPAEHDELHTNKYGGEKWYLRRVLMESDIALRDVFRGYAENLWRQKS